MSHEQCHAERSRSGSQERVPKRHNQLMKSYYVYILKCSDNSYYTGVTNDMDRRLLEHEKGIAADSYTSTRRPVELVFAERFNDIWQAVAFEKQVKGWSRKKKEAIIKDNWDALPKLAQCNNDTNHANYERDKKLFRNSPFDSAQGDNDPATQE